MLLPVGSSIDSSSEGEVPRGSSPVSKSTSSTSSSASSSKTSSSSSSMCSDFSCIRVSSSSVRLVTILSCWSSSPELDAPLLAIFTSIISMELLSYSSPAAPPPATKFPSVSPSPASLPDSFRGRPRLRFCCERAVPSRGFVCTIVLPVALLPLCCSKLLLWLRVTIPVEESSGGSDFR
uniref:Uncharacterized protein n=1 Tax=Anopheles christyi TaxID=43041 RepID=A0A182KI79_9DIPT